jgi:hypothetical protein
MSFGIPEPRDCLLVNLLVDPFGTKDAILGGSCGGCILDWIVLLGTFRSADCLNTY